MATFFKRGKTWYYSMDIGKDKDGKRKKQSRGGFKKKQDAMDAVREIENQLASGTYLIEKDLSFRQFSEMWLKTYSAEVKKSCTRVRKIQLNLLYKYFDAVKIKDITPTQYQGMLTDLVQKGYAESTISGTNTTGKMVFKEAAKLKAIRENPTLYARIPRKVKTLEEVENETEVPKYMEKEQLATFLRLAHDGGLNDDYAIFLTLAYTGIRIGELCALKWPDVDFENNTISITKTNYNPNSKIDGYELLPPKTIASKRLIDISKKLADELLKHQARQRKAKMANRNKWHDEDFVFTNADFPGYPLYDKKVRIRMARLIRLSGLSPEFTPHSLRHTHTSLLAEAGASLEEIMQRLGHINDKTTRTVYLHVTKDMKKEAAHKFDKLMDNL